MTPQPITKKETISFTAFSNELINIAIANERDKWLSLITSRIKEVEKGCAIEDGMSDSGECDENNLCPSCSAVLNFITKFEKEVI